MDWHKLYFGRMSTKEVLHAVKDPAWQRIRISMKNQSLEFKYDILTDWLDTCNNSRKSQVQVTNYVTALSRGGLISPSDYRRNGE